MELRDKLAEIVARVNPKALEKGITDGADLTSDLGFDSYDHLEMIIVAEAEFGIEIHESDTDKIRTFGHLVEMMAGKLKNAQVSS